LPMPWTELSAFIGVTACPDYVLAMGGGAGKCWSEDTEEGKKDTEENPPKNFINSPDTPTAGLAFQHSCDNFDKCHVKNLKGTGAAAGFQGPIQAAFTKTAVCEFAGMFNTAAPKPTPAPTPAPTPPPTAAPTKAPTPPPATKAPATKAPAPACGGGSLAGGGLKCPCVTYAEYGACSSDCNEFGKCLRSTKKTPTSPTNKGIMYPSSYGGFCGIHKEPGSADCYDLKTGKELPADKQANWCKDPWCFVSPCSCDTTKVSDMNGGWTTATDQSGTFKTSQDKDETSGRFWAYYSYKNCDPKVVDEWAADNENKAGSSKATEMQIFTQQQGECSAPKFAAPLKTCPAGDTPALTSGVCPTTCVGKSCKAAAGGDEASAAKALMAKVWVALVPAIFAIGSFA